MSTPGREEFAAYAAASIPALRRLALLLCRNWHDADDLVQAALARLCLHWDRAAAADNTDAYARGVLVREFTRGRRTAWARRVSVTDQPPEILAPAADLEGLLDLQAAIAGLAPRQRAVLVLRYYCDLDVAQAAAALGCTAGTVKSQTAKALAALRSTLVPASSDIIQTVCSFSGGHPVTEIINGYRVQIARVPASTAYPRTQQLCAQDADGLFVYIDLIGNHPAASAAAIFRHLRLLGTNPANWATSPFG